MSRTLQQSIGLVKATASTNFFMRAETMHKMCLGKTAFKTWAKANKAIRRIAKEGVQMRSYSCELCLKFHLTRERIIIKPAPTQKIKESIPEKPKKWSRYAQWCIDNCLKYPDVPINELKKMARREIAKQDLALSIKRDKEIKAIMAENSD